REARMHYPKMREKDLAHAIDVSEAEVIASFVGFGNRRLAPGFADLFGGLVELGEISILTGNKSAVQENVVSLENFRFDRNTASVFGQNIQARLALSQWAHGYAVERTEGTRVRRSLQFFDRSGDAVHKISARSGTDMKAWDRLVETLSVDDDAEQALSVIKSALLSSKTPTTLGTQTDATQSSGILQDLDFDQINTFKRPGKSAAWPLDTGSVAALLRIASSENIPVMCFVKNAGSRQVHTGHVGNVVEKGQYLNVMDPKFHLHLRLDHIAEVWAVRKPSQKGQVTAVQAFDLDGQQIIQFRGSSGETNSDDMDWHELSACLPRLDRALAVRAAQ
ncbi:MAG: ChuX/HutX family heme-like substrate-binding protein, partial [Pseudomonadota bacterium]